MRFRRQGRRPYRLAFAALLTLGILLLHRFAADRPFLNNLETQTLNLRFQLRGPIDPGREIALVLVDDRTLSELGQWPLSRSWFADAIRGLKQDGARVIALNLLFTNSVDPLPAAARAAIGAAQEDLKARGEVDTAGLLGRVLEIDPDRDFEAAMREADNVLVPFAFVFDRRFANVEGVPPAIERFAFTRYEVAPDADPLSLAPRGILAALPGIAAAGRWGGHVTIVFDTDGTPRYEHPVIGYAGELFPSLPIAAYAAFIGAGQDDVTALIPDGIAFRDQLAPTDPGMRLTVHYYGPPATFPTYSFVDLVKRRLPADAFRDKLVLIGGTALGISDSYPSPFTQSLPGVERYASVIANMLRGDYLQRSVWSGLIEVEAILVGGLAAFLVATRLPVPWAIFTGLALVLAWSALDFLAFARWGLWVNYVLPLLSIVANFVAFLAARVFAEERQRRRAERQRANLGRYFSPNIVEQLAGGGEAFSLDREIEAAVMFVDMIGFTRLSERMAPAEAIALLREFHGCVERAVFAHNGTLDKFLGDGAMTTFGPPVPGPDDAANAVAAARAVAEEAAELSRRLVEQGRPPIGIGIGLHYGPVLMGNVGGERRFEFTVVGDTVNVASRLESLTRAAKATIIASDALVGAARRTPAGAALVAEFTPLAAQPIRGREGEINVWAWPARSREQVPAA